MNHYGIPQAPGKKEERRLEAMQTLSKRIQSQINEANTSDPTRIPYLCNRQEVVHNRIERMEGDLRTSDSWPIAAYRGRACRVGIVSRKGRKVILLDFDSMSDHLPSGSRLAEVQAAIPHNALPPHELAIKDTPESLEVLAALQQARLVKPKGRTTWAERVKVPVWNINGGREN